MSIRVLFIVMTCISAFAQSYTILPIPQEYPYDRQKAKLGKLLFSDPILSKDNTISCATCHDIHKGGSDSVPLSVGIYGQYGLINSPTVFNSVFNFVQFWDGRAKTLEEQALGPIQDPAEMGHKLEDVLVVLSNSYYKDEFYKIYRKDITKEHLAEVLAEYEKTLITPNGDFDRYLGGDENAISDKAKKGYKTFQKQGCIICHHGVNVGGNFYSKVGIVKDTPEGWTDGRYAITKDENDMHLVKVPTLRNIALTAPYLHDGHAKNLNEAIIIMMESQLGVNLTKDEVEQIEEFLKTLNGKLKDEI